MGLAVQGKTSNPIDSNIRVVFYQNEKELYTTTDAQGISALNMSSDEFISLLNDTDLEVWSKGIDYPIIVENKLPGNYPYFRSILTKKEDYINVVINDEFVDKDKSYLLAIAYYSKDNGNLINVNKEILNGGYGISLYNSLNKLILPQNTGLIKVFLWENITLKPLGMKTIDASEVIGNET